MYKIITKKYQFQQIIELPFFLFSLHSELLVQ